MGRTIIYTSVLHHWSFILQWRHVRVIRLKLLANRQFIQTNSNKNINHWPFGKRDPPMMRKAFPCHDVIMSFMQSRRSCRRQEKVSLLTSEAGWRWLPSWILIYSPRTTVSVRSGVFRHNQDSVGTRRLYRHHKTSLLALITKVTSIENVPGTKQPQKDTFRIKMKQIT